jgi:hypothetical protein
MNLHVLVVREDEDDAGPRGQRIGGRGGSRNETQYQEGDGPNATEKGAGPEGSAEHGEISRSSRCRQFDD